MGRNLDFREDSEWFQSFQKGGVCMHPLCTKMLSLGSGECEDPENKGIKN